MVAAKRSRCGCCCRFVRWSANTAFWACFFTLMLIPLAIVCILGFFVLAMNYSPENMTNSVSGSTTFISDSKALIAWQEPFLYEAKVYASTRERIPSNATRFFESAELLWASGPQSLANRKPYLCGKATVSLPESLMIITDSVHRGVYAHVFIQKTNSQLKHPDMNDPHIVHSVEPLVWWEPPAKMDDESSSSNSAYLSYRNTDKSNFNYQLVASKSVSWAIVMDESIFLVYSALNLDIDKQPPARASHLLGAKTLNPVVFRNQITRNRPGANVLLRHRNDGKLPLSADVDIELQGVKSYLTAIKIGMLTLSGQSLASTKDSLDRPIDGSFSDITTIRHMHKKVKKQPNVIQSYIQDYSVYSLLALASLVLLLFSLNFISIKVSLSYWIGPKSKWIGMSRTSFALTFACTLIQYLRAALISGEGLFAGHGLELLFEVYILLILLGSTLSPLSWISFIRRILKSRNKDLEQQMLPTNIDITAYWETSDSVLQEKQKSTSSSSGRDNKIIAARKDVDKLVLYYIRKLIVPIVFVVVLGALVRHSFRPFSYDFVDDAVLGVYLAFMWVETIPQILVNYRVRSATLVPIIDSFNFVGTQMIIWILHNAGIDGWFDAPTLYMVPNIICQTIVVVQFFIYYKDKQD